MFSGTLRTTTLASPSFPLLHSISLYGDQIWKASFGAFPLFLLMSGRFLLPSGQPLSRCCLEELLFFFFFFAVLWIFI